MSSAARRRGRRGIILIEMSIAIGLFAGFIVVATHLIFLTLKVSRDASADATTMAHFDAATDRLRQDVWGASGFEVERLRDETSGATALRIGLVDGTNVRWRIDDDGTMTRDESDTGEADADSPHVAARWPRVLPGATFSTDGGVLVLTVAATPNARLEFPSQFLLLRPAQGVGQ